MSQDGCHRQRRSLNEFRSGRAKKTRGEHARAKTAEQRRGGLRAAVAAARCLAAPSAHTYSLTPFIHNLLLFVTEPYDPASEIISLKFAFLTYLITKVAASVCSSSQYWLGVLMGQSAARAATSKNWSLQPPPPPPLLPGNSLQMCTTLKCDVMMIVFVSFARRATTLSTHARTRTARLHTNR
ncbi:hypothetical protein JYU34_002470 [Plutella xylostella]|uniref:Uncharacterized protein n=1 Tax=Plutella xylostella TaxID=51655 RepID=A0ABQ7R295_PLUXY|nr:hypothetical protein JYU34_002470 [Plutella xylostella]